ncbi:hypothetical protein QR680_011326 [Steinernema hermaphroditum]|uniref:Uncharacterized protein n=1 Tax=Steinernema hermaphroditum TaxID=289476 RepID=A0AA39MCM9_9BILA|nr:hypothetical protein QR680_011326 [Steinernema hermaphroditum]
MPLALTGSLHPSNRDAVDWSEKGLLAFGCHCTIVVVDVLKFQIVQTLDNHNAAVNLVAWTPIPSIMRHTPMDPKLASSDLSGSIVVWDVLTANITASFRSANSTALDMKWLVWQDANRDFLLALHSNNSLILWNSDTGEKIWEHRFAFHVYHFSIDPFESSTIAFSSTAYNIVLVKNVVIHKAPAAQCSFLSLYPNDKSIAKDTQIVHFEYHKGSPNVLLALTASEIFVLHVPTSQILFNAKLETSSPLLRVISCRDRDAFYAVHQNGHVAFRCGVFNRLPEDRVGGHLSYEIACYNESQRNNTRHRVMAAALCPVTQASVCLLYNSGRIVQYQLKAGDDEETVKYRQRYITDLIEFNSELKNVHSDLRLAQHSVYYPLSSNLTTVAMRPMENVDVVDQNSLEAMHLAAVGTHQGIIHLVNIFTCHIEKDLQVHSCPIKCLEWGGSNIIVSAAYSNALSTSSVVRNDIFATDICTGTKKRIRPEVDESPIELMRVSFYQCYLALAFQREPLEIWDLKSMRLLRRMSRACPIIVDMAWSGKHHTVKTVSEMNVYRENLVVLDNENHLYHVVVKGLHVRDGKEVNTQWKNGSSQMKCMVWKDDILALGDSQGRLGIWDLSKKQCRQTNPSSRGQIMKMTFSRLTGDHTLAVQHQHHIVLWDTDNLQPTQHFNFGTSSAPLDMDLCGVTPIYIASDSTFRYASTLNRNAAVAEKDKPLLVNGDFNRQMWSVAKGTNHTNFEKFGSDTLKMIEFAMAESSNIEKCANIARFLGDMNLYDLFIIIKSALDGSQLPKHLMKFWPSEAYKQATADTLKLLIANTKTLEQLEQNVESALVLGKKEWAMDLLLNNDLNVGDRASAMKACLISAELNTEHSQCFTKMIATNLIASNHISDGVQLLFLIAQGLDACRYLQSQGLWHQSVSYAKMGLPDAKDVVLKWVEHLMSESVSHKSLALMVLISLSEWREALTLLISHNEWSTGRILVNVLKENDIVFEDLYAQINGDS